MKVPLTLAALGLGLIALSTRDDDDEADGWVWPVTECDAVSSKYGRRRNPFPEETNKNECHHGLDIPCREGAPVVASRGGRVVRADMSTRGGGLIVIVQHADKSSARYMHLSRLDVVAGDTVATGAQIGAVGSTGRSTGPHLHFEVRRADGSSVDPATLVGGPTGTPC